MAIDLSSLSGATQLAKNMWGSENASTWSTTFSTPQGDYTFISEDAINKGIKVGDKPYVSSWFLNSDNLAGLKNAGQYVDLTDVKASGITAKDTWGNWVKDRLGQSPKGFIVPAGSVDFSSVGFMPSNGPVKGIAKAPTGELVYATSGGHGNSYITKEGEVHDPYITYESSLLGKWFGGLGESVAGAIRGIGDIVQELGPIGTIIGNAALPGLGTGLTVGTALGRGADPADVLKSVAISQGLSELGSAAAPEVDLNAATSGLQDVYGGNLPIEDIAAAFEPVVPEAVTVGAAIPTPDIVATPLPAIEPSVVQPDYFSADAGPLADTTVALDEAFVQDMSQGIEPVIPPENPFLAGMEETTAIEGAGVAGAENPTGTYEGGANYLSGMEETAATEGAGVAGADNPTGATTVLPTEAPSLTPQQAYQLLKLGAGLFGGAGALTMAAKGLAGGAGALGGLVGPSMSSIQAPTPFTGTYSGMNPYDAAYFQQVQQNYNRLFPTTPANVAGPLESWYQTKYVPDTTISNKLFGV